VNAVASVGVNTAVSECEPSASTELTDAVPPDTVWVDPTCVAPSMNATVPAAPDGLTVAVSVSVAPDAAGDAGVTPSDVVVATGPAGVTVYGTAVDVDAVNAVASVGVNTAVSECEPSASTALTDAVPPDTVWVDPTCVAPSMNATVPGAPDGLTVAVRVSVAPDAAGDAGVTPSDVVVGVAAAELTVYGTAVDVDPVNAVASVGVNTAVSECEPSASTALTEAVPAATVCVEPTCVAPSMNFTVPAAPDGETVAVSVSVAPCDAGDGGVTASMVVVDVGPAVFTVNGSALEVDAVKFDGLVGVNAAVIECEPTASVDVIRWAVPPLTATGEPRLVVPSLNWTEPTAEDGATVAVKVTEVPLTTGLDGAAASVVVVVVAGDVIVYGTAVDVDEVKAEESVGVNTAVRLCDPAVSVLVVTDAVPPETVCVVPTWVAPSMNFTVPAAALGESVAVSVTEVPATCGEAGDAASVVVVDVGTDTTG
jgi:hypothetical protein